MQSYVRPSRQTRDAALLDLHKPARKQGRYTQREPGNFSGTQTILPVADGDEPNRRKAPRSLKIYLGRRMLHKPARKQGRYTQRRLRKFSGTYNAHSTSDIALAHARACAKFSGTRKKRAARYRAAFLLSANCVKEITPGRTGRGSSLCSTQRRNP